MTGSLPAELRDRLSVAVDDCLGYGKSGVLLSGGIDSSTIATLAWISHGPLPMFTGYYDGDAYDERRFARLVTRGFRHHEVRITPQDFLDHFDTMIGDVAPPYAGPGTFGQWMVARYAAQYVDVVLSGEGGDELFGGYARLLIVAGETRPDGYDDYALPDGYPRTLEAALAYDMERLPDLLRVDEQVTRAHQIRAVAPMLHAHVTSWVLGLPARERVGKRMLRQAMRGMVPDAILDRTDKRGFPVPFVEWAQGPLRDFVGDRIGYVPSADRPWDRQWWNSLCVASAGAQVAA
jgi:asparagine synthetase B (glutamine-hydrolysing)